LLAVHVVMQQIKLEIKLAVVRLIVKTHLPRHQ
jgi:hypothetical protein